MKKVILGAALCVCFLGSAVTAQTTAPATWAWSNYQAITEDNERAVWLETNVPTSSVSVDQRIAWVEARAEVAEFLGKLDSQKAYFDQMDSDAARVRLTDQSLFKYRKACIALVKFNDTAFAETVAKQITDVALKNEALSRTYSKSGDWEKLLPVAEATGNHFKVFQCYDALIQAGKSTEKIKLFESGKKALEANFGYFRDARQVIDVLIKTDWTGTTVTRQMVLDTLKAYRKTIPPMKAEARFLKGWGELAGDLDMQIQLLEVELARGVATK
ncbi:MAG: hypothetical protein FWD61_03815 [Phycisphaerales bacterium]|nr:hypothetical protein [Phycisphaerales bacterium]